MLCVQWDTIVSRVHQPQRHVLQVLMATKSVPLQCLNVLLAPMVPSAHQQELPLLLQTVRKVNIALETLKPIAPEVTIVQKVRLHN